MSTPHHSALRSLFMDTTSMARHLVAVETGATPSSSTSNAERYLNMSEATQVYDGVCSHWSLVSLVLRCAE